MALRHLAFTQTRRTHCKVCAPGSFYTSPQRKFHEEIRACACAFRAHPDAAAVSFHHLFGDEETEARRIFYGCGIMVRYE